MENNDDALLRVSRAAFAPESDCVQALIAQLDDLQPLMGKVESRARLYIESVRMRDVQGGIEAFQREYSLDSYEGIMMMCLAEALLRIPDKETANGLIHDKLASGDWEYGQLRS